MPRTRSAELAVRDEQIAIEAGEGIPRHVLAKKYGISEARLSQIILAKQDEISDDANRALLFAQLDFVKQRILEIFSRPRPVKVNPSGRLVYEPLMEDGEPVLSAKGVPMLDYTKPVYDDSPYIEAAKMVPNLIDRQSRLYALDRPKPKERDESAELKSMLTWAESIVEENRQLKRRLDGIPDIVVDAEVIPPEEIEGPQE